MKQQENLTILDTTKRISGIKQIYRSGFSSNAGFNIRDNMYIYAAGKNVVLQSIDNSSQLQLVGHDNTVCSTCVSNNSLIASGQIASPGSKNYDSPVLLWKIGSRDPIGKFFGLKEGVKALMFSKDSRFLAGVSYKDQLIIWDIKSQNQIYLKNFQNPVLILNFSNDNVVIVVGKSLQNISLTTLLTQNKPPIYTNFTLPSTGLPRSYTCSIQVTIGTYVIGTQSGQLCLFVKGVFKAAAIAGKGKVSSITTFNQKQLYVAVGNQICKYDLINQQLKQKDRKPIDSVKSLCYNQKGQVFGMSHNSILVISSDLKYERLKVSHGSKIRHMCYRNGIIASIDEQGFVFVQQYKNGRVNVLNIWRSNPNPGRCVQIASNGSILAGFNDGKILSLSVDGKKQQWEIAAHKGPVTTIYGSQAYILSGGQDCVVRIWSKTRQLINQLSVHQKGISKVLGDSMNLSIIHSCSLDRSIQAYDLKNDKKVYFKQAIGGNLTDIVQDNKSGQLVTCGFGSSTSFWKFNDHQPYRSIKSDNSNILKLAINQSGSLLVLGHQNGLISVFNVRNNNSNGSFFGHSAVITGISWIDDNVFITSSQDFCISIWFTQ